MIKLVTPPHQFINNTNQVAAHIATDTAIVHLKNIFLSLHHQLIVDADCPKFVDDYRHFFAMLMGENTI